MKQELNDKNLQKALELLNPQLDNGGSLLDEDSEPPKEDESEEGIEPSNENSK